MQYNHREQAFKGSESGQKKPERYSRDSFTKELIGKVLKISLLNEREIQGRLLELGMFDVKVQTTDGLVIIMKGAISTVQVI